jgi:hypothetical protein
MQTRMSARQWAEVIREWDSSGLSGGAFASERGIAEKTLRWWKTELARRSRNESRRRPPRGGPLPAGAAGTASVSFAKVVRVGGEPSSSGRVTIVVGRARLEVEQGFDRQLLCDVVRALEGAR